MKDPGPRHRFLISYNPVSVLIKRESGTSPRSVLFRRLGAFFFVTAAGAAPKPQLGDILGAHPIIIIRLAEPPSCHRCRRSKKLYGKTQGENLGLR